MQFLSWFKPDLYYDDAGVFGELYLKDSVKKKVNVSILRSSEDRRRTYILKVTKVSTRNKAEDIRKWIETPVNNDKFIWPVDMVKIPENISNQQLKEYMPLRTDINYSDKSELCDEGSFSALVFPFFNEDGVENLSDIVISLIKKGKLNYENPLVMKYIKDILTAVDELNQLSFIFNEFHVSKFHPSRFYFRRNGGIIVDFSTLTVSENIDSEFFKCDITDKSYYDFKNPYPLEFADPFITLYGIGGTKKPQELQKFNRTTAFTGLDKQSQNFSLAAFIFFLMYGQMPYWGYILAGEKDDDIYNHYRIYRDIYLRTPAFIFDFKDHIYNDMADYGYEGNVIRLWEKTPKEIQDAFMKVLSFDNALRLTKPDNPSAAEWLELLSAWCG